MSSTRFKDLLIIPERPLISSVESNTREGNLLSRRDFLLRSSTSALILAVAPSFLLSKNAEANVLPWLMWTGRAAFAGGVSWLVGKVLDRVFPHFGNDPEAPNKIVKALDVQRIDPKPTGDAFHNSYGSPYAVMNPNYRFASQHSNDYNYYVALDNYLRADEEKVIPDFKDLSTPEIKRLAYEEKRYKTILFPCGQRETPISADIPGYRDTCAVYDVDPNKLNLEYVRPFGDADNNSYTAYGVEAKDSDPTQQHDQEYLKDLLISV